MSDKTRALSNEAMEQIIENMTAERQNIDGQYVPLGFTPSSSASEPLNWNQQTNYINRFTPDVQQYPQHRYNFLPQAQHMFEANGYKKDFDVYKSMQNGNADIGLFDTEYPYVPQMMNNIPEHPLLHSHIDNMPHVSNPSQLIDLVGNWMVPNNSGTYSPFGTSESYKPNVFDLPTDLSNSVHLKDEPRYKTLDPMDDIQFQFTRDARKPRMVAEVKPMRPSYSDVLTKPVPQTVTKPLKNERKDSKPKKDSKKNNKNEKNQKVYTAIGRNNVNNDFKVNADVKDISGEKNSTQTKSDKKTVKGNSFNRKWASLDNISDPQMKVEENKKKKNDDDKNTIQKSSKKFNKTLNDVNIECNSSKSENSNTTKNGLKKICKPSVRPKQNDSFGSNDRPPGKRIQRSRKKENHIIFGVVGQKLKQYTKGWWKIFTVFILWLFHLISDICQLSLHISRDMAYNTWTWICLHWFMFLNSTNSFLQTIRFFKWLCDKFKGRKKVDTSDDSSRFTHSGLQNNINMPTTGDEAMKRLLACKGKDPYSILGVAPTCTDDDIKRYYKRQAFLVHPDKNNQPGAEEAFKILVHAFDMIGEPERRASYDRGVVESAQVVQAWSELTELLQQLQQKVEAAANTIRCSSCGLRHKRVKIERPSYAARNCNTCKIHHSAREGDIWAEAKVMGFLWHYYACMEGAVYDITEWAGCQRDNLKHLRPDSHHVQYRIALGKQNQPRRHTPTTHTDRPDLENLLNTLYGQSDGTQNTRRRNKKGNK
ncbi:dnaJ homolog dnj-5 isoform X1 [Diorhabda sublineata]|uniref:dnaJ homolog dnj-5 isoform X1 n=1 Tax=Diorhabda sublineata TaxID=1163346 RepID=UPI0024E1051A|nr:dnaJ homolog dnj-5 isoform X1 [Diorhabda sublineata]